MSTHSSFQKLLKNKPVVGYLLAPTENGTVTIDKKTVSTSQWVPFQGVQIGDKVLYPLVTREAAAGFNDGRVEIWNSEYSSKKEDDLEDGKELWEYLEKTTHIPNDTMGVDIPHIPSGTTVTKVGTMAKTDRDNIYGDGSAKYSAKYEPSIIKFSNGTTLHARADGEGNWPAGLALTSVEKYLKGDFTPEAYIESPDLSRTR